MNKQQQSMLLQSASSFPPPKGTKLSYGTAGFRADASILQSTVFRIGILAALRSLKTGGSVIGLMITASHNKVSDNGVKIADPSGGMVTQDWEPFADSIANAPDPESLIQLINEFAKKENIPLDGAKAATVLLGRDTRPSGESLVKAAKHGICSVAGAVATDMGIVTTPQLHWMVRARNKGLKASELDYFEQLSSSFRCLIDLIPKKSGDNNPVGKLIVDCANGVGGEKLQVLKEKLNGLHLEIRNSGESGILNEGVGADYVQKEKVAPEGFGPADVGIRCASLDGDADRLVYFTVIPNGNNKIELVDGDKILSLFALFIKDQLSILGDKNEYQPRVGVVQTAYANGASTKYLNQLGLQVIFTPTGVKYLHGKAEEYDIGIYFEANGHGTILFSEQFLYWLEGRKNDPSSTAKGLEKQNAVKRLWAVTKLINQAVGDALSGLLLVEAILQHMGWSVDKWNELYHDLPSRQLKVKVADRSAVVTNYAETSVEKPPGIQEAINAITGKYPQGRCFVRPSGTEDVVRVYAEANTQEAADELATQVAKLVDQFLGFTAS
ncbi:phosphoacetylglucosamine mutase [Cynara cardunculus var. scolymus]|uniref:phosphoacetylglucosamine mutase n=1 Tax=Cynara cardunculus var. scolymus TaxID=59895 RepID=UPI000D62ACD1|nr:phosphoacetylglucosamine mutase [Cynara cardunculus var. scolymus]